MLRLFIGHDPREEVGTWTFCSSVIEHASRPVAITPLHKPAVERLFGGHIPEGTNAFTVSRFLIPAMCDYMGVAVFADGADMVCRADITKLMKEFDDTLAVKVVRHQYSTQHKIKYRDTYMECQNPDYERKNWASLMLINCSHPAWRQVSPGNIGKWTTLELLQLRFIDDTEIGFLGEDWNWLADEYGENDRARIVHWTAGIPGFPYYKDAPMAEVWRQANARANYATD